MVRLLQCMVRFSDAVMLSETFLVRPTSVLKHGLILFENNSPESLLNTVWFSFKTAARSSPLSENHSLTLQNTDWSFLFSLKITASLLLFLSQSCVFLPFLFFSFLSSTLPTWEDNSPARKMIFLPLNHAAALFLFRPLFFLFYLNKTSLPVHIHAAPSFLSLAKT